ncbi:MAG: PorP/SprF family type IX secretion system membrane protein [Bacteroidota bacterium]|nr:PorP/SprF family type IX secretion system membrane protein [Bacteroidota bacterium]
MKKITWFLLFVLFALELNAQQIGMYSHYFYKPMVYNPAFTGSGDATNVMFISRAQFSDFKGAPQLNIVTLDGSILNNKAGLGVVLISDRKGISSRTGGDVSYSYRLKINEDMSVAFGISLGVVDHMIDYSKAQVESLSDPTLFSDSQRKTVFNASAGLAFNWKELEFGFAVPQIIGNRVNYLDSSNVRSYYTQARHFMGSLKYKFFISKEKKISITPLGLVRFVPNTPLQYDANLNLDFQDKFWIGATYKSGYAVGANAGFCIHKQFYVGYSYDFIIGNIGKYSGMSHELMLNFKFGKNKKAETEEKANEVKVLENEAYVQRMDSLQQQLKSSEEKLKALSEKLDQQAKLAREQQQNQVSQPVVSDQGNQNSQMGENSPNKKYENGVLIVTSKSAEFKDNNSQNPPKGYYVVIGTYYYRDLAQAEAQRFVARGYKTTDWVYSGPKNFNYIFMFKIKTKEEALEKLKVAKEAGVKDAWIQEITD